MTSRHQIERFDVTAASDGCIALPFETLTGVSPDHAKAATQAVYAAGENVVPASFATLTPVPVLGEGRIVKDGEGLNWLAADRSDVN